MHDLDAALRHEFDAGSGSFLLALRTEFTWSEPGFLRLVGLMQAFIEREQALPAAERDRLARWAAEGFWYLDGFVREWATDPRFPRTREPEYYERAFARLADLAFWYFTGASPEASGTLPSFWE